MKKIILMILLIASPVFATQPELTTSHAFELGSSGFGLSLAGARVFDSLADAEKCPALKDADFFLPLAYMVVCLGMRADGPPATAQYRLCEFECDATGILGGYLFNKALGLLFPEKKKR